MPTTLLGTKVKQRRLELSRSRPELAFVLSQRLGERIDQSWIARVERGEITRPDKGRLRALAAEVGLDPNEVLRLADYSVVTYQQAVDALPSELTGALLTWQPRELRMLTRSLPSIRGMLDVAFRVAADEDVSRGIDSEQTTATNYPNTSSEGGAVDGEGQSTAGRYGVFGDPAADAGTFREPERAAGDLADDQRSGRDG